MVFSFQEILQIKDTFFVSLFCFVVLCLNLLKNKIYLIRLFRSKFYTGRLFIWYCVIWLVGWLFLFCWCCILDCFVYWIFFSFTVCIYFATSQIRMKICEFLLFFFFLVDNCNAFLVCVYVWFDCEWNNKYTIILKRQIRNNSINLAVGYYILVVVVHVAQFEEVYSLNRLLLSQKMQ